MTNVDRFLKNETECGTSSTTTILGLLTTRIVFSTLWVHTLLLHFFFLDIIYPGVDADFALFLLWPNSYISQSSLLLLLFRLSLHYSLTEELMFNLYGRENVRTMNVVPKVPKKMTTFNRCTGANVRNMNIVPKVSQKRLQVPKHNSIMPKKVQLADMSRELNTGNTNAICLRDESFSVSPSSETTATPSRSPSPVTFANLEEESERILTSLSAQQQPAPWYIKENGNTGERWLCNYDPRDIDDKIDKDVKITEVPWVSSPPSAKRQRTESCSCQKNSASATNTAEVPKVSEVSQKCPKCQKCQQCRT